MVRPCYLLVLNMSQIDFISINGRKTIIPSRFAVECNYTNLWHICALKMIRVGNKYELLVQSKDKKE